MQFTTFAELTRPAYYQVNDLANLNFALSQTTTPGGLRVDDIFQPDVADRQRRRNAIGQRLNNKPATGVPSRWLEKDALPGGQAFADPYTMTGATTGTPQRTPHYLELKALMGEYQSGTFNTEVTAQQGVFRGQDEEDMQDTLDGLLRKHDRAIWQGAASSISVAPNSSVAATLEYCGIFNQLSAASNQFTDSVAAGASIVQALMTLVAEICAQDDEEFMPTAIYMAPLVYNFICLELEGRTQFWGQEVEVTAGKRVKSIATAAGDLPLVTDNFMGSVTIATADDAWPLVILTEDLVEYHYLTTPDVRIFEMPRTNIAYNAKRVMVKFGALGMKRAANAHGLLKVAKNWTPPVAA